MLDALPETVFNGASRCIINIRCAIVKIFVRFYGNVCDLVDGLMRDALSVATTLIDRVYIDVRQAI